MKKNHQIWHRGGGALAKRRANTTRAQIVSTATRLFLERGYSATSPKAICEELNLSTGNLTYYFQTKEHLLAVLVEMLCRFQWKWVQDTVQEGLTSVLAVACGCCAELLLRFFGIVDELPTAVWALGIFAVSIPLAGVNMVVTAYWQAAGPLRWSLTRRIFWERIQPPAPFSKTAGRKRSVS